MSEFTKGEWRAKPCTCSSCDLLEKQTGERKWIITHPTSADGRFKKDDALLIAAAPDLLAACEDALDLVESDYVGRNGWVGPGKTLGPKLEAAIAKAKTKT